MHSIDGKIYLAINPDSATDEQVRGLREVTTKKYRMVKFTVPTDFAGLKFPFEVYITNVQSTDPIADQAKWVWEERGGKIPEEVMESFRKLHKIARENSVSFVDLCVYAMGTADKKDEKTGDITSIIADAVIKEQLNTAQNPAISTDAMGLAIRGYDPVAYFTGQKATKGDAKYFAVWDKALWFFVSEENRKLFIANPTSYAPGFGGYCTYCMGVGHKIHADPEAWSIYKGVLYLHANTGLRDKWLQELESYLAQAKINWADKAQTKVDLNSNTDITSKVLIQIEKNNTKQSDTETPKTAI